MRQTDQQIWKKQNSLNLFQVPIEFIFFKLEVMVTSCGVVGWAKNRSNAPKEGFFRLPSIVNTDETSQKLSRQRRDIWLSRINRKDLTPSQLAEKNSTLHVCGSHFILGRPAALFEPSNPDWAPSLNLGYKKLSVISSPESACERNARRKRRNENKTVQDEKRKGNKKNPSWNN